MELRQLTTFLSIVDTGSFSKAASKLGYTQSTVTAQIQQLEQSLSGKLFEKIGRGMVLTPLGKELVPYANELLDTAGKIENLGSSAALSGDLRIAAAESLISYKLQNILKRFRQKAPDVRLSIFSLNCYVINDALLSGNADIGLLYDVGSREGLTSTALARYSLALVCSPSFRAERFDFCKPDQQLDASLVINEKDCIYRGIFENYLKSNHLSLENTIELWSLESIKKCVAGNLGISFLPRFVVEEELKSGQLKEIRAGCSDEKITAICSRHKNKWLSPAMSLFMRLVEEDFQGSDM